MGVRRGEADDHQSASGIANEESPADLISSQVARQGYIGGPNRRHFEAGLPGGAGFRGRALCTFRENDRGKNGSSVSGRHFISTRGGGYSCAPSGRRRGGCTTWISEEAPKTLRLKVSSER